MKYRFAYISSDRDTYIKRHVYKKELHLDQPSEKVALDILDSHYGKNLICVYDESNKQIYADDYLFKIYFIESDDMEWP